MIEIEQCRLELLQMKNALSHLHDALGIQNAKAQAAALEAETHQPQFYNDVEQSQKKLQAIRRLTNRIDEYQGLYAEWEDAVTLCELALAENEGELLDEIKNAHVNLQQWLDRLNLQTLLSGQYDRCSAIVTLHAGAGGTEAQDWANMLLRMFKRFGERRGFKVSMLDCLDGDEAGIKSATILVDGPNAYGFLRSEKGVHRLVRISPFDSSGRRHTSFASADVMPDIDDEIEININPDDLKIDTYRSSGAGGQHVNKTDSAVRITHIPTGVVCACQNERSQRQNRETAMKMLKAKLVEIAEREHKDRIEDLKGVQMEIGWGSQIRSYVFHPYSMVKDHRTSHETGNVNAVMDGDLDGFINAYLTQGAKQSNQAADEQNA